MGYRDVGCRAIRVVLASDLDISGAEQSDPGLAALAACGSDLVIEMTMLDRIASIAIRHLVLTARGYLPIQFRKRSGVDSF